MCLYVNKKDVKVMGRGLSLLWTVYKTKPQSVEPTNNRHITFEAIHCNILLHYMLIVYNVKIEYDAILRGLIPVSYTHLDVYKRQN